MSLAETRNEGAEPGSLSFLDESAWLEEMDEDMREENGAITSPMKQDLSQAGYFLKALLAFMRLITVYK